MTTDTLSWLAAALTVGILLAYEVSSHLAQRAQPQRMARSAHAQLREDWFRAVSAQPGSEILAVQTLRNSVMSATMSASTAVLGLIGTATLAAPGLRASIEVAHDGLPPMSPRLALELVLLALLLASMVSSVMAVRYFTHASYIGAMPVGCVSRAQWAPAGLAYVRRAGLLYSWGLRHLVLIAPLLASILHPLAGPVVALVMVATLARLDRAGSPG
jgi:hypothetical protein